MIKALGYIGLGFLLFMDNTSGVAAALDSFTARYGLTRNGIKLAEMERTFNRTADGTFVYESRSRATGFLSWFIKDRILERSTGTFTKQRPHPLNYIYQRSGGRKKRYATISFDWKRRIATNTVNDDAWRMPIPAGTQDKMSYQLALMHDLETGSRKLEYSIADGGRLKFYQFTRLGAEKIATAMGKLETLKIHRIHDKRNTTIWLAPELDFLPVRIEQKDKDGSHLRLLIQAVTR